tara:strand:+ start:24892 stop:27399 length:2508 start_codon:yes stop_codon:yes gene_type:complete
VWWLLLVLCFAPAGCSRTWYRNQADEEVAETLAEKGGYLDNGLADPRPESRMAYHSDPDQPPMPRDDPASHAFMHEVDGHSGFGGWHSAGSEASVDAGTWFDSLPRAEDGTVVLSLGDAVKVARTNSRGYQTSLEDLYLSALDVTFERFRFDHQFAAGNVTGADFQGRDRTSGPGSSELATTTSGAVRKLTATGGELFFGLANSIVWEFAGGDGDMLRSTFDFSLIQPLLRFGGRARVLERLTQSERTLLGNVRQMEQFRQGFYVDIATGRNSGPGPNRRGAVGQAGLGVIAGSPSGRNGAADAGGFLGLLQDQQQIQNQVSNIAALRDSLAQLEAAYEANRTNRLQVDQARQALLNGQSSLLAARAGYESRVDSFKVELGLPPDLPLEITDPLLDRFTLIAPELSQLQNDLAPLLYALKRQRDTPQPEQLRKSAAQFAAFDVRVADRVASARDDFRKLQPLIPERLAQLDRVRFQVEETQADVDPRIYDRPILEQRLEYLAQRLPAIEEEFASNRDELAKSSIAGEDVVAKDVWEKLTKDATRLSDLLLELSLIQAETRLQGVVLIPLDLKPNDAVEIARARRLDWMNARANLVDVWRQIEVDANNLESDLDLVINGQARTRGDNVTEFHSDGSRLSFGLEFDTPVTRLAERNQYRETLINYQRARRDYMLFEDRVTQSIRNTLRIVDLSQINFEVRRAAVQVAIAQVDFSRIKLNPPPPPGQKEARSSPTAARDLVSALSDLLDAQNDFLNVWVNYEVLRLLLDFELGTMELDNEGLWRDPGPIVTPTPAESERASTESTRAALKAVPGRVRGHWKPTSVADSDQPARRSHAE